MQKVWILLLAALTSGCAEPLIIRSVPPGAQVTLNGSPAGTTPMTYQARHPVPLDYRIEMPGLPPATGRVDTRLGPGRVIGAVFTLGILAACRPLEYFTPSQIYVNLGAMPVAAPPTAVLRLYNIKSATVLEGECMRDTASCTVTLANGEQCSGEYVRSGQATTVTTTPTGAYAEAVQNANGSEGVTVLKCRGAMIDCKLTLDASGMQGLGECNDGRGTTYRATLTPPAAP